MVEIKITHKQQDMINQVGATLSIENMHLSEYDRKNLKYLITNKKTTEQIIKELNKRYSDYHSELKSNKHDPYTYLNTNILINKFDIIDEIKLKEAECSYTSVRLLELHRKPLQGTFDFNHLCKIHRSIFFDLYKWAGKIRTVDIGKNNLFCLIHNIPFYAEDIFANYYNECFSTKGNINTFIRTLAKYYADLNALHPFREGNGRSQREFARELCLQCGYVFDLTNTSHEAMLQASIKSFNKGDNSGLESIFSKAVIPIEQYNIKT